MLEGKIKEYQQAADVLFLLLKELHVEYNRIDVHEILEMNSILPNF